LPSKSVLGVGATSALYPLVLMKIFSWPAAALLVAFVGLISFVGLEPLGLSFGGGEPAVVREEVTSTPIAFEPSAETATQEAAQAVDARAPIASKPQGPVVAASDEAIVHMHFVDEAGEPIADVAVRHNSHAKGVAAHSAADGRVQLRLQASRYAFSSNFRYAHPRFASDQVELEPVMGETLDGGTLVLRAGGSLVGRVVDERGVPLAEANVSVAGAQVSSNAGGGMTSYRSTSLGQARTVTDDEGRFALSGLLAGDIRVDVDAEQGLYRGKSGLVAVRQGEQTEGLEIVAPRTDDDEMIEGIVLDPNGDPVPYISIDAKFKSFFRSGNVTGRTLEDGTFRIVVMSSVEHDLTAKPRGSNNWNKIFLDDVEPGDHDVVLRFSEANSFQVRAVDGSGVPVANYAVSTDLEGGQRAGQFSAREERESGITELRIPDQDFWVNVIASGFAEERIGPLSPSSVSGLTSPLDIRLTSIPGVSGVVKAGGVALANATVQLQRSATTEVVVNGFPVRLASRGEESGTTDEEGRFHLSLRKSGSFVLRIVAPGYAPLELGPFDIQPSTGLEDQLCELSSGGSIRGSVRVPEGTDPAGIIVAASRGDCYAETVRTDETGEFVFEHLLPGPWMVRLNSEELDPSSWSSNATNRPPLAVLPSNCWVNEDEVTEVDLQGAGFIACTLRGQLVFPGVDLSAWSAKLVRPLVNGMGRSSDRAGEFRLAEDGSFDAKAGSPGEHILQIAGPGERAVHFAIPVDLRPGDNFWDLQLEATAVKIRATSDAPLFFNYDGADGVRASVQLSLAAGESCTLTGIPAGSWHLMGPEQMFPIRGLEDPAPKPKPNVAPRRFELKAGETIEISVP
jgi:protocatechuate 3,4-dioxygenase beta subunit